MARSPILKPETPGPRATIWPAVSWPKIRGAECEPVEIFFKSVPQIPQVCTRSRTSPRPISGTGTVSKRTSCLPRYTAAFMVVGTMNCSGSTSVFVAVRICKIRLCLILILLLRSVGLGFQFVISSCLLNNSLRQVVVDVQLQPITQCQRRTGAVARQRNDFGPLPRPQSGPRHKSAVLKASSFIYELIEWRHNKIRFIRNRLHAAEGNRVLLCDLSDGCGLHINSQSVKFFYERRLRCGISYLICSYQHAATNFGAIFLSCCRIDNYVWRNDASHFQAAQQRAGQSC